jgi:hypothetical protein
MRNAVELQHLQPSMIDLHDRRYDLGAAAAFDGEEDLLRRLVHNHVIDNDIVIGGAHKGGELQVEAAD